MDIPNGSAGPPHIVKKQEDVDRDPKGGPGSKPDLKPATKTLNRVPRTSLPF